MKHIFFIIVAALCLTAIESSAQGFTFAVTPRTEDQTTDTVVFTIVAAPTGGFKASIFLKATIPTIPQVALKITPAVLNQPYRDTARLVVKLVGSFTGTHQIVIEGSNAGVVMRDTVSVTVKDRPAWRVFDTTNSPLRSENTITGMVVDHSNVGWIGTYYGLLRFDGLTWTTDSIGVVGSLALDSNGAVWVAVATREGAPGRLGKMSNGTWTWYEYPDSLQQPGFATGSPISSLLVADNAGNIWIGFHYYGVVKFDGTTWSVYNKNTMPIEVGYIATLAIDGQGTLWLVPGNYGLLKYDGTFWTYLDDSYYSRNLNALRMYGDPLGNMWLNGRDNLVKVTSDTFLLYTKGLHKDSITRAIIHGFPDVGLFCMAFDTLGRTWTGNRPVSGFGPWAPEGGLAKIDTNLNLETFFTTSNSGLPENDVWMVATGRDLSVWALTASNQLAILDGTQSGLIPFASGVEISTSRKRSNSELSIVPNPVRDEARISYNMREPSRLRLSLVDNLGREVATLLDRDVEAGQGGITVATARYAPGVYLLRMTASGTTTTESVVIVR